ASSWQAKLLPASVAVKLKLALLELLTAGGAAVMVVSGGVAVTVLVFISTETVLEPRLATARSGLPSPLRSPTATDAGLVPAAKKTSGGREVPPPSPSSNETWVQQ